MERGRGQLVEDGKEKGPEQPEGEVEDKPNDGDGEEPGGRGRGVAVLGGVWCPCWGPRCLAVGRVEVDVAAVADENGLLVRGEGAGMAGFLQQGLVLRGSEG